MAERTVTLKGELDRREFQAIVGELTFDASTRGYTPNVMAQKKLAPCAA